MASLAGVARERTDLGEADVAHLQALMAEASLVADLAFSDLVLWLPTWNEGGFVAGALVRPSTAATAVPEDLVGRFVPRGRRPVLDRALALGRPVVDRAPERPLVPRGEEAVPVRRAGRVVAVLARHASPGERAEGDLERIYLSSADDLLAMAAEGTFPGQQSLGGTGAPPRVGDGILRLDPAGLVEFASPNARSAFARLGLATDLVGSSLASVSARLTRRPGPVDEALALVAAGRLPGGAEVENAAAAVTLGGIPLRSGGRHLGALVLVRDVTDLRRRERALLGKDATIREIHHRVKNNLQTVAALLRMQARRIDSAEAKEALDEAVRRVGAIAVVHETLAHSPGEIVPFDEVADRVVAMTADTASALGGGRITRVGEIGLLPSDLATPLAMVLSELLMNAVEHGLGGAPGDVALRSRREGGQLVIDVEDDGSGVPDGVNLDDPATLGLGLQIVRTLVVDDIGGTLGLERRAGRRGTRARVVVPLRA